MEKNTSELWDNFKQPNICIIRVSEEQSGRPEKLFKKIKAENCLNLTATLHSQIQEAQ